MSNRINLHLPTYEDFIFRRSSSEKSALPTSPFSASSFKAIKAKLDHTSQVLHNLGLGSQLQPLTKEKPLFKLGTQQEIQELRNKVAQLEREKMQILANRNFDQIQKSSKNLSLNPLVCRSFEAISDKIKIRPDLKEVWIRKLCFDKEFLEDLDGEDYPELLLKCLLFIEEVVQMGKVKKVFSLKSSTSIRKERIKGMYQRLNEFFKNRKEGRTMSGISEEDGVE